MTAADIQRVLGVMGALGIPHGVLRPEGENGGYDAAVCDTPDGLVRFRAARVTPRKSGLFVAVWRRAADGGTEPFDTGDQRQLVIVAREGSGFGAFVFPREVLASRGVLAVDHVGGKRGFRVYPPWSEVTSPQATATQRWQCAWFLPLTDDAPGALDAASRLF
ncbi:MepB family protein [Leifsonia sp. 1010]|uniref:MepB family protein n=1 Tax=Leifsonia sp. 1010 TaxID=2817769 RepID=UPI002866E83E|nr:MepB family protein [Leifsonia sp. 1010]MDR6614113.1 hypothetical protein [Leifsonia sp. 1010]